MRPPLSYRTVVCCLLGVAAACSSVAPPAPSRSDAMLATPAKADAAPAPQPETPAPLPDAAPEAPASPPADSAAPPAVVTGPATGPTLAPDTVTCNLVIGVKETGDGFTAGFEAIAAN